MSDQITVRGFVATEPKVRTIQSSGTKVTSFRLATTERRFDREHQEWVDGTTNWYTISMFRSLATNAHLSLHKGQPVVVTGRLRIRNWETEVKSGTAVEIEADAVGHDLSWGVSEFQRVPTTGAESLAASNTKGDAAEADQSAEPSTKASEWGSTFTSSRAAEGAAPASDDPAEGDEEDEWDPVTGEALTREPAF